MPILDGLDEWVAVVDGSELFLDKFDNLENECRMLHAEKACVITNTVPKTILAQLVILGNRTMGQHATNLSSDVK